MGSTAKSSLDKPWYMELWAWAEIEERLRVRVSHWVSPPTPLPLLTCLDDEKFSFLLMLSASTDSMNPTYGPGEMPDDYAYCFKASVSNVGCVDGYCRVTFLLELMSQQTVYVPGGEVNSPDSIYVKTESLANGFVPLVGRYLLRYNHVAAALCQGDSFGLWSRGFLPLQNPWR